MAFIERLEKQIEHSNSRLCIGLDPDIEKLPGHLAKNVDGILEFNQAIIEATQDQACAYKLNIAFYEVFGSKGWELLEKTLQLIPENILTIADAKRGDIGNTANQYAKTFFKTFSFDAITVNPYMGIDTIEPFTHYTDKGVIVLALTSNPGASDFQFLKTDDKQLFEKVAESVSKLHQQTKNCLLVVGATQADAIKKVRQQSPGLYFLVPGIGAQGGSLHDVFTHAGKKVIINSSRQIIFAGNDQQFADAARNKAIELNQEINQALKETLE